MKNSLITYKEGQESFMKDATYKLPQDKEGLTKPYTAIMQYDKSTFLMKEDDDETNLYLMDLGTQKTFGSYHCALRDGKDITYTPYDYIFDFSENNILLGYRYLDRWEVLHIDDDALTPIYYYGEKDFQAIPSNYDDLKYVNLCIRGYQGEFYILKSANGTEDGNVIEVVNINSKIKKSFQLDKLTVSANRYHYSA